MLLDSYLQSNVINELKGRPNIDDELINVGVNGNIVTLSGKVSHYAQKEAAEMATKSLNGVEHVKNEIEVEPVGASKRTDPEITEAALRAIKRDFQVPSDKILVIVNNGWVTLAGNADWLFQKEAAKMCVQYLTGVTGVTNSISVKPAVNWFDIKNKLEERFRSNQNIDLKWIAVETDEGTVTLSGIVSSATERSEAVNAAWATPGVNLVKDDLIVAI